jgi:predicted MFS family arabinose efflux permease
MAGKSTPKGAWRITLLLLLYMIVNFADKIVVGLAGAPIMSDLRLTPSQFGLLGSAFFLLFSITAVAVGFLINKVETRLVLLGLALLWSLVQFPMMWDVGFTTLLVCRIVLGAGEGPAISVATHALYKWFPDEKRMLPTAILNQGGAFGVILAVPALNWVIINHSWHAAFGALGVVGLVWAALWIFLGAEGPLTGKAVEEADGGRTYPYARLLATPTFIGSALSTFGAYWALSIGLTWFTPFLVNGLGFSQREAGFISITPWALGAVIVLVTGWISQRMTAAGFSTRHARGVLGAAPLVVGGLIMMAAPHVESRGLIVALLVLGSCLCGSIYVVCPPMLAEFTPTGQRGAVISIYGALYTLAGVFAAFVMGGVIQRAATPLAGYLQGYQLNGAILVASGLCGLLMLRPNSERARLAR